MDQNYVPLVGDIVVYTLSASDAEQINRRRTSGDSIRERIDSGAWPLGAQAHIGNPVSAGENVPMMIIRVWSDTCVNGRVLLDGNDTFWATSVHPRTDDNPPEGCWFPRTAA